MKTRPTVSKTELSVSTRHLFGRLNEESQDLEAAIDHHWDIYGTFPERVLVDKIYRTMANRAYCKERDIEMPGSKPGRPPKHLDPAKKKAMIEAENRCGAIERRISHLKFQDGLSLVRAKRIESIAVTIDFALVDANLDLLLDLLGDPFLICVRDGRQTINVLYQMMGSEAKLAG
ncbi:transposase [Lacticaseibacillus casei]|uniref:Transposase n=1 Tax=Lacticaseibacillus huelsenbergensis TaxID=3035291 RepID=A0ABY8DQU2_9LACO|nr:MULTISPECIES: transposase [Lacticaseibacillus]MDG3060815.1 transposase [Lacticaseibacillus sp. BCRC 81376]QVI37393.1 transposase [Lacticaseibacillus casei]QXG59184.1 transposase [Lacticaseibacillus casei]WFB39361.1 transposase [Lacticaseibacillus huelsenbergensis]WFB41064.1 transposase [Lacticaseibacillus huelsenbergensis]